MYGILLSCLLPCQYYYLQLLLGICKTVVPSLAVSIEPLAHHQNAASLSLFYRYYFGRCSSELAQLIPLPFLKEILFVILTDCMIFLLYTIHKCYKDIYVNSFFPCTERFWNFLPIECFPLTYNLNGFKSNLI